MTSIDSIEAYAEKSNEKFENYKLLFEKKELEKAGEILWGAIVNMIDLIRLTKNAPLDNHQIMRNFLKSYAASIRDNDLWELFKEAEKLHPNFYHSFMDKDYFEETATAALKLYDKLRILAYEELEKYKKQINRNQTI
jgi:hypothetical protein